MEGIFDTQHSCVWGQTQSGKTYFSTRTLEKSRLPVLFFNPQYEDTGMIQVSKEFDIDDIIRILKKGEKLDYYPSSNVKYAQKELDYIINGLFQKQVFDKEHPFIFAIDECHIYAPQGSRSTHVQRIATGGFKFGFRGVFISQSPASVDKLLLKQSSRHIFFKLDTNYEGKYMKEKGFDFEEIDRLNGLKENYNGVMCDFGQIKSTVKI